MAQTQAAKIARPGHPQFRFPSGVSKGVAWRGRAGSLQGNSISSSVQYNALILYQFEGTDKKILLRCKGHDFSALR